MSYGAAVVVSMLAVIAGIVALKSNGVAHSTVFSSIVARTWNPVLDDIFVKYFLGAYPTSQECLNRKSKFGVLTQGNAGSSGAHRTEY
jgi:hypothetical protein